MSGQSQCRYLDFPDAPPKLSRWGTWVYLIRSVVEFPFYWLAAVLVGAPGMSFRARCFRAGVRLLAVPGSLRQAYRCIVAPMDSVRHFEMEFFWQQAGDVREGRILDVSSPRLFTLLLLKCHRGLRADFLNPDPRDLEATQRMAAALGVAERCRFESERIGSFEQSNQRYELVVCMSVLEHIVDDVAALKVMWALLAPGGKLLLSVPCAATSVDEYCNVDEYGLLEKDGNGYVFWQRYYDQRLLGRLFEIVGKPATMALYGERVAGSYDADVRRKRTTPGFPRWRESLATARAYARMQDVATLPGMGVIAMEFTKQADSTT